MNLWLLWGKTSNKVEGGYHPALCHMIDVASVARVLLAPPASSRWRTVLGHALGADPEALAGWLPWLIALHDIGKISAAFQLENDAQAQRLRGIGVTFGEWRTSLAVYHTDIGQSYALRANDSLVSAIPRRLRSAWAQAIAGHHGQYAAPGRLADTRRKVEVFEPPEWANWRSQACQILYDELSTSVPQAFPEPQNISAAIATLTGFTILCDWLGSDTGSFPAHIPDDPANYAHDTAKRAVASIEHAGLVRPSVSSEPTSFAVLFNDKKPARPLQQAIDDIPRALLAQPCLAIIEAPTGEGKTEAALALAHRLARYSGTDELYYALPTTATSNSMFRRVEDHLHRRLKLDAHAKLIHGQAFLVEDDLRLDISPDEPLEGARAALEWFGPRKRALLAPFGVGTVDQCELAALSVRHGALRLVGLAGKTVILDEIHSYDVYMTTVIERLLAWLSAVGTSVILLSATLPLARRRALARAYAGEQAHVEEMPDTYPSIWVVGGAGCLGASPGVIQPERHLKLNWLHLEEDDLDARATWLMAQVEEGGCVCWITNTVKRAQRLFEAVRDAMPPGTDCMLLHAQFPLERRSELENRLRSLYGPPEEGVRRPSRGIVIGTQVIEQSLDLDFDVMATDIAPIDLLLQRAGRLQRHRRIRPLAHAKECLWVQVPSDEAGQPHLGVDKLIYAEYTLLRTWEALQHRESIVLPADYRPLIEAVYDEEPQSLDERASVALAAQRLGAAHAAKEAELRMIAPPDPETPYSTVASAVFEEHEGKADWIIAQTRLGAESITVVPLEREAERGRIPFDQSSFDLRHAASREDQLRLRRHALRISNRAVIHAVRDQAEPLPRLFRDSPLLAEVLPLWLQGGVANLTDGQHSMSLRLDEDLGLVID